MRRLWLWLRTGESLQRLRDAAYVAGYLQAVADRNAIAAAERIDESGGTRQPYPNE